MPALKLKIKEMTARWILVGIGSIALIVTIIAFIRDRERAQQAQAREEEMLAHLKIIKDNIV